MVLLKVKTYFIGIKNVGKADSFHISKGIGQLLTERLGDTWWGEIVAMGTDGASKMVGKNSGVIKIAEETNRLLDHNTVPLTGKCTEFIKV